MCRKVAFNDGGIENVISGAAKDILLKTTLCHSSQLTQPQYRPVIIAGFCIQFCPGFAVLPPMQRTRA